VPINEYPSKRDAHVTVVAIHLGPVEGGPLEAVASVHAHARRGLEGDRHFRPLGAAAGQALTLVEQEVAEGLRLAAGATRRQLTVRGIRLNELVGKRFTVGEVECYGVRLCEPCLHLQQLTRPGLITTR
jgi:hypothetical protein